MAESSPKMLAVFTTCKLYSLLESMEDCSKERVSWSASQLKTKT